MITKKSAASTRSTLHWMLQPEFANFDKVDLRKNRFHVISELIKNQNFYQIYESDKITCHKFVEPRKKLMVYKVSGVYEFCTE